MDYFFLIISLIIPTIIGAGVISFIKLKGWGIKLILSFGLGTGLITFLMFWWSFLGLSPEVFVIIITLISIILLGIFFFYWRSSFYRFLSKISLARIIKKIKSFEIVEIILILVITLEIGFVLAEGSLRPLIGFDALANWAWKAKLFFYQPQVFFNSGADLFLGGAGAHPNYPLHIPLLMTWTYFWLGQVNDIIIGLIFAFYFIFLVSFIYFSLRDFIKRKLALIFTVFLSTLPLFLYHGFHAYADLALSFYFTIGVILLFKYISAQKSQISYLFLSGLFFGLSAWVKSEGLMLFGVVLIIFLIYLVFEIFKHSLFKNKSKWIFILKQLLIFISSFAILVLPWIIFKINFGLGYSNVTAAGISWSGFHPEIFISTIEQIFISSSFHLWPGIFLLILILAGRRAWSRPNYFLGLIIFGVILAYFILYLFVLAIKLRDLQYNAPRFGCRIGIGKINGIASARPLL